MHVLGRQVFPSTLGLPLFFSSFHFGVSSYQMSTVMLCTWSEHAANSSRGFHQILKNSSQ